MSWSRIGRPAQVFIPTSLVLFGVSYLLLAMGTLQTTLLALFISIFAFTLGFTFMAVAGIRVFKQLKKTQ